jgi:predicted NBD/HSP70 family sugar kinase
LKVISGNSKVVRNINRAVILNLIRTRQPLSRATLAKITGLNKSTVSSIAAELLEEEIIEERLVSDQNIGRNPYELTIRKGKYFVGAINMDSTITHFAIVDIDGSFICTSEIKSVPGDPENFIDTCLQHLTELAKKNNVELWGVGVSITGIVDPVNMVVKYSLNLRWDNVNVGEIIRKKYPEIKAAAVGNDAKASALAEQWFGTPGFPLSDFVFISICEGLGSGLVIDNKIFEGETHGSGEFGHMALSEGGEKCSCGNYGCWEAYASDRATVKRYYGEAGYPEGKSVDNMIEDIVCLAKHNDSKALEVLNNTGYYLGLGISNIIKLLDPNAIILGGKITSAWDIIYPEIMKVVKERTFLSYMEKNTFIQPTSLKVRPHLLGAATLVIKLLFDDYKITE